MPEVTYGRLDEALRSQGFSARVVEPNNWEYRHAESGAPFFLPVLPADKPVLPRHLVAVRTVLQAYGMSFPLDLAAKTLEVS